MWKAGNGKQEKYDPRFASSWLLCGIPVSPWTNEFWAQAEIVLDAHDNLRELRLKLRDPARAIFNWRHQANDLEALPVLEAMAYLCSKFGPKYEESQFSAAY